MNLAVRIAISVCLGSLVSGCIGYPPGAIRPGAEVSFLFASTPGSPEDCFAGPPFEAAPAAWRTAAVGHMAGDEVSAPTSASDQIACHPVAAVTSTVQRSPRYEPVPIASFRNAVGSDPETGHSYTVQGPQGDFTVTVQRFNETQVFLEFPLPPPQAYPEFGVDIAAHFEGDEVVHAATANVTGSVFEGPVPPLALTPGNFTVVGSRGADILVASGQVRVIELPGHARIAHVGAVVSQTQAPGGYGVRDSPWVDAPAPMPAASTA